jgi:hypothetical protein
MMTIRSAQKRMPQGPVGTARKHRALRREQASPGDPNVPTITNDISRGVYGAPFQRNAEERRLWCDLLEQAEETSIVTVHCRIEGEAPGTELYIQRNTFLRDRCSGECARLLHTEGMPHPPEFVVVGARGVVHFTLYFEALPCHCSAFDLEEHSSDPFPFTMRHIERNSMDVYHVVLRENQNA